MNYRLELSAKAEWDIDGVLRWFQEHHAIVAGGRWLRRLMARIDTLETNPNRCRLADESHELGIELRELLFGKRHGIYRLLFIVDGQTVSILHIRHAARSTASWRDLH